MANRSVEDPRKFVLYEQFTDKAAFDAHLATDSLKENVAGRICKLIEPQNDIRVIPQ